MNLDTDVLKVKRKKKILCLEYYFGGNVIPNQNIVQYKKIK
jgi:hypothetical protein